MADLSDLDTLFEQTLLGDYDDDAAWRAVGQLQSMGSEDVFNRAIQFCISDDPARRARGIDVLAQLGVSNGHGRHFSDQARGIVENVLSSEKMAAVMVSSIYALGHFGDVKSLPSIIEFVDHTDSKVREAVAFSLGNIPENAQSTSSLITLMNDHNENVRNWAPFGLGAQCNADSTEVRSALIARLNDSHLETRTEAMYGLAKRSDLRVLPSLLSYFDEGWTSYPAIDAATDLLSLAADPPEWGAADYALALRQKFSTS